MRGISVLYVFAYVLLTVFPFWCFSHSNEPVGIPAHVRYARQYVGHTERGWNRSKYIDSLNRFCGVKLGSPYCGSFVSKSIFGRVIYPKIRDARASAFVTDKSISAAKVLTGEYEIKCGDILVWHGLNRFNHVGFASKDWDGAKGMTIQANTSSGRDTRDGEGIYEKLAFINPFSTFRISKITPVVI